MRAIFMSLRFLLFIIGTSLFLTYTTSPISLTDGLEWLLSPLKLIKVPVSIFSMMMTIALRFIPTLVEETEKIMNAQSSRGADFSSGNLVRRAKALIPLIIPLFASSFKRAGELASAMECRCYAVDRKRTKMVKLTFHVRDLVFVLLLGVVMAFTLFLNGAQNLIPSQNLFVDLLFYII
jgi:energy-coupling factor transport system permease protein